MYHLPRPRSLPFPKVIQRKPYGKPVDVWSAGILLHILLSGTMPFLGTKDRLYESVCTGKLFLATAKWQYISDQAKDLVSAMFLINHSNAFQKHDSSYYSFVKCSR